MNFAALFLEPNRQASRTALQGWTELSKEGMNLTPLHGPSPFGWDHLHDKQATYARDKPRAQTANPRLHYTKNQNVHCKGNPRLN